MNVKKIIRKNIVRHIRFSDLKVRTNRLVFDGFAYRLPDKLHKFEQIKFKELLYENKDLFLVIPKNEKEKYFTFLHQSEEDHILNIFWSCHIPAMSSQLNGGRKGFNSSKEQLINDSTSDKTQSYKIQRSNKTRPNSHKNILATNVQAFQLKIKKGSIKYTTNENTYVFKSVKIERDVPNSVLDRIEHYFTLVKDTTKTLNGKKELRFYFEPANDLSFLLAEVERLSHDDHIEADKTFPQSGEFEIPWRFVKFYDGILIISHPNPSRRGTYTPYYFRNFDILKSFEDIRPYIEKRSPKLRVQAVDGVITCLLNFKEFMSVVTQYKDWEKEEDIDFINTIRPNNDVSKEVFARNPIIRKSPYLSYLSTLQHDSFTIKYLLERVIHESGQIDTEEYGYLFTIKSAYYQTVLLYENISDSLRSSILFYIDPDKYLEAVEIVRKFLASERANKRQKLSYGKIRFKNPCIRMVKRIKHTDLIDWKSNLKANL